MRLFLPSPRQTNLLLATGFAAFGLALYLRYGVVEAVQVEHRCALSPRHPVCTLQRFIADLFRLQLFGWTACIAAVVHFWRPRLAAFATAMAAAILGLVLYNPELSALAVAVLIIAFARPAHATGTMPAPSAPRRTTPPASSKRSR